jgi:hypothetical protein
MSLRTQTCRQCLEKLNGAAKQTPEGDSGMTSSDDTSANESTSELVAERKMKELLKTAERRSLELAESLQREKIQYEQEQLKVNSKLDDLQNAIYLLLQVITFPFE